MKTVSLLLAVCFSIIPRLIYSQDFRETPIGASELAQDLNIFISKFEAEFPEPVYATVLLREGDDVTSYQTRKPAKKFPCIMFKGIPSEIGVELPKQISFYGVVTGQDDRVSYSASVNTKSVLDPKCSRAIYSFGMPYISEVWLASDGKPPVLKFPLDQEVCLFEYELTGFIDQKPSPIKVRGFVTFSKIPNDDKR